MADVAVVTGAGRGIGRQVALRLGRRGHTVLATDLVEDAARETADLVGDGAEALVQDVRDPDSHREVAERARQLGRLGVWVNSAGVLRTGKAWDHPDEDIRLMVEANLLGVLWGSRTAVEAMRPGAGHIVNMASMSSFGPVPGLAVYGATKHGVHGFTLSLQGDLEEAGIPVRVHAVCPDGVDTGMVRERVDEPEAGIIWSGGKQLLGAEEVAERVVGLLDSDRVVLAIPRSRAWTARLLAPFPRLSLKVLPLFRRLGERNRPV